MWADNLQDQAQLSLPAVQTYADGQVVKWDQDTNPGQPEPENPAPILTLAAKDSDNGTDATASTPASSTSDTTARWLGGVGLAFGVIGAVGGIGALLRNRRS